MSDVNSAASPVPAQTNTEPAVSATASKEAASTPLTLEQVQALLAPINERFEKQSAVIRRLQEAKSKDAPPPELSTNDSQAGSKKSSVDDEVKRLQKQFADEKAKLEARSRNVGLREAINTHGLDDDQAKILRAYVEQEYGKRIKVDDGNPDEPTVYLDRGEIEGPQPVSELIDSIMKSKIGDMFRPAKKPPTSAGLRSSSTQPLDKPLYHQLTAAQKEAMTDQQRAEYMADSLRRVEGK